MFTFQLNFLQQYGKVLEGLFVGFAAVAFLPGAAKQFLGGELVEFDQPRGVVIAVAAAAAGIFGGDAHQAYGLALQRRFDLLAQIGLRFVECDPYFQPGLALGIGEQVDIRQVRKLGEDVSQRQRADPLQVDRPGDQQRLNADQGFAFEGDVENLVLVADFRDLKPP